MNKRWSRVLGAVSAVFLSAGTISAQALRQEKIEPAPPDKVEEFLVSEDARKIYRALIVEETERPPSVIKPLWLFLTEAQETAFRVRDRTRKGYHLVDVLPMVREALAGKGHALTEVLDEALKSEEVRKRAEACRLAGMLKEGGERFFVALVKASEDDHGFVRIAALRALPVHGKDAIDPLFRRLKRCSAWRRGGKFSFEEICAICTAFGELSEFAPEILPRLTAYRDPNRAPDAIVRRITATVEKLSH